MTDLGAAEITPRVGLLNFDRITFYFGRIRKREMRGGNLFSIGIEEKLNEAYPDVELWW